MAETVSTTGNPPIEPSAAVFHMSRDGEISVLLVREIKNGKPDIEWSVPSGDLSLLPDSAGHDFTGIKEKLKKAYVDTFMAQGWENARKHMHNGDKLRQTLAERGIPVPSQPDGRYYDLNGSDAIRRELKERIGLDLDKVPTAQISQLDFNFAYGVSSEFRQPYQANPSFLIDLGLQDTPPPVELLDKKDLLEVAWVPLRNIHMYPEDKKYYVQHTTNTGEIIPLCRSSMPTVELGLNAMLENHIRLVSDGLVDSPLNVKKHAEALGAEAFAPLADVPLNESGKVSDLTGPQGMDAYKNYIRAAAHIADMLAPAQPLVDKPVQVTMNQRSGTDFTLSA